MDFKDILWMPIDLPVFDKKDELVKEFKTDFTADAKSYDVRGQLFLEHSNNYAISKVKEGLTYSQNDLIEYCKTNLPFTDLVNIKIHHITTSGMKMHIDFGDPDAIDIDDRYVLFCMGWIDKEKHKELINRSIDKYSDYIVKK